MQFGSEHISGKLDAPGPSWGSGHNILFPVQDTSSGKSPEDDEQVTKDQGTITDICNTSDVEVELVSLIEEQIPLYRLRADTLTQFSGYDNEDWYVHTPVISPDAEIDLSPELIEGTLKYFLLCGDRISQMTKTYNDIDAVTRLLEEKEHDLELAARIGQSLLEQNKDLKQRNELLEQEYSNANETVEHLTLEVIAAADRVTQLRHELTLKTGLLHAYSQDLETDSEAGTPTKEKFFIHNWEELHKKVQVLEDENEELRSKASVCEENIEEVEKKESDLITDFLQELGERTKQMSGLQDEVAKKAEDNLRQQEEITQLLAHVVELQQRNKRLAVENVELSKMLTIAKECQNDLSAELIEVKEKYGELLEALQEFQEETRRSGRSKPNVGMWPYGQNYVNPDSLACELENSMGRDSDGYGSDERTSRVFETVKCANGSRFVRQRQSCYNGSATSSTCYVSSGFNPGTSSKFTSFGQLSSISSHLASDSESAYADSYHTDDESLYSSLSSTGHLPGHPQAAGSLAQELELALKQQEGERKHGSSTPSSFLSRSSSSLGGQITYYMQHGPGPKPFHLSSKLQIVKPMEGSLNLAKWQQLAQPHLGALFEVRQGVQVKGGDKPKEEEEQPAENYSLSDYEEDEDYSHPGKSFVGASSVFTLTNSNPSSSTSVTPSYPTLQLSTHIASELPSSLHSPQQSPFGRQRNYSATQSLAKMLNERGIHGMVPTVISNANEKIASTTPTPAPSPENSPPPSPPPYSPVKVPDLVSGASKTGLLARGSHLLKSKKRKETNEDQKMCESKSQQTILSIKLLERLGRIGLENIMESGISDSARHRTMAVGKNVPLKTFSDQIPLTLGVKKTVSNRYRRNNDGGELSGGKETSDGEQVSHSGLGPISSTSRSVVPYCPPVEAEISGSSLSHDWGKVPFLLRSQASLGLTPGRIAPPVSFMPNPLLQVNCLKMAKDVGPIKTLKMMKKGGYS